MSCSSPALRLSPRITILPIIHGSGDFALAVRQMMLEHSFDCLAVPLPPSFQRQVELAIDWLPMPTLVAEQPFISPPTPWQPEEDPEEDDRTASRLSYVPIDPCQGVIAALRMAMGEHIPRAFVDLETDPFLPYTQDLPDPYALKEVSVERFAAAVLPAVPPPPHASAGPHRGHMAHRLRDLERKYQSILLVCSLLDWPWIRDAYQVPWPPPEPQAEPPDTAIYEPDATTLVFLLGELPFITGLYERARCELEDDGNLSVDGVKELLITARTAYRRDLQNRSRRITPHTLSTMLKYVRNLTLLDHRLTPDLYNLVIAAKQVAGDGYALHVAEQAREYPFLRDTPFDGVTLGVDKMRLPNGDVVRRVNRLPGPPVQWRSCRLLLGRLGAIGAPGRCVGTRCPSAAGRPKTSGLRTSGLMWPTAPR